MCDSCAVDQDVYGCKVGSSFNDVCAVDDADADDQCGGLSGESTGLKTTCDEQGSEGETGQGSWNPGGFVYFDSVRQAYIIDSDFMEDLLGNPDQLLFDSARAQLQSDNSFRFQSVSSTDLAYRLGIRNNDKPVSINSYSLSNFNNMWKAYVALEAARPSTLTFTYQRSGVTSTRTYIIE